MQSAYRSFFVGVREGRYALERGGDLWRLLVALTLHSSTGRRAATGPASGPSSAKSICNTWTMTPTMAMSRPSSSPAIHPRSKA